MKSFLPLLRAVKPAGILFFLLFSFNTVISQETMRASLYISDANGLTLVDGNFTNYDNIYCNCVDWDDAWKMNNPGENFCVTRDNVSLIVERRKIICEKDTTSFSIWNLQQNRNYRVEVLNQQLNHPNLIAFFKDNYLGTSTPVCLNGSTAIDFNINTNPASYAIDRFQLIFEKLIGSPMSVSFTGAKAYRKTGLAMIEWQVENEMSIDKYIVEKSIDGRNFKEDQKLAPGRINSTWYQAKDEYVSGKENFYRIKAISLDGKVQISELVKLAAQANDRISSIGIFPNPVINKKLQLEFANFVEGEYALQLVGANGIIYILNTVTITGSLQALTLSIQRSLPAGIYTLMIIGPGNSRINTNVNIL
ncbi:MAG: hypothetical protein ABIW38_15080 [Ferruginibacter sp.]